VGGYYYFVSTLPFPLFGQKPGISFKHFMELARIHLAGPDFNELNFFHQADPAEALKKVLNASARRYLEFDIALRNRLAELRAGKLKADAEKYKRSGIIDTAAMRTARQAFDETNPQKAAEILLRAGYDFLSDLEVWHSFDIDVVLLFSMRLKITEERSRFDAVRGRESFEHELARALEKQ